MAFDFYFAGSQCEETTQLMRKLGANTLKSYINDIREIPQWFEFKRQGWTGKLLIDSGAFTVHRKGGTVDIDAYIKWLNDNDEFIDYAIELDHIPGKWGTVRTSEQLEEGAKNSWKNYLYMIQYCKSPEKILPVFHQGENFKYLEQIVNFKINENYVPYICISGNKELTNKQREEWYARCYNIIVNSNNPHVKVHCLGSATMSNVEKFPFTSMDATSWIMTGATGGILTDYGVVQVSKESVKDKSHISHLPEDVKNKIEYCCTKYGITLSQVMENYKYRMLLNINYLYDLSNKISFKSRNLKQKTLF